MSQHIYSPKGRFIEPATKTLREGSSKVWHVINLTDDNHPLHIHLGMFVMREQRELVDEDGFKDRVMRLNGPWLEMVSRGSEQSLYIY